MFTKFEERAISALHDCTGIVKQCAVNAVNHLRKAAALVEVDNEMAAFRAITAEEEAATALIHSLQINGYENAANLKTRQHVHKLGVSPMVEACARHLVEFLGQEESPFEKWVLEIKKTGRRRALGLGLKLRGRDQVLIPQPPLHVVISRAHTGGYDVADVLRNHLEREDSRQVKTHIDAIANQRNLILYANSSGIPSIEGTEARRFIRSQKVKTIRLLYVLLLSDPWVSTEGRSGLIQQVLDSYLILLARIDPESVVDLEQIRAFNRKRSRAASSPDAAASAGAQSSESPDH